MKIIVVLITLMNLLMLAQPALSLAANAETDTTADTSAAPKAPATSRATHVPPTTPETSTAPHAKAPSKPGPQGNQDDDITKNEWAEAQSIVDEIKTQNPPDTFKIKAKLGLVQTQNNVQDPVGIGLSGNSPAIAIEAMSNIWSNLGIEAREVYAQNAVPDPNSNNGSSAYMSWFDAGPRWTFYLDSTRLDNNIVAKILYHENYNNFVLEPDKPNVPWVNYYSGISLSFERNIPITSKLGIMGMFDLLQIFNASSPTINIATGSKDVVAKSGYGFEIQAEVYYKMQVGRYPTRIGFSYWQQGNANELDDTLKSEWGKNNYFQVSRALFTTMSVLF